MMKIQNVRSLFGLFFLMTLVISLFLSLELQAQNAPVTTLTTVGNVYPGQVDLPITVTNFNNIGACSLTFEYQYAGLHFMQGVPNSMLDGFAIGDHDLGNGKHRVTMGWFGSGVSLPNGEAIMMLKFIYISGTTALEFFDNGPSCEYADASYNVLNDVPQNTYYINGTVCGNMDNPGPISGVTSLCRGQSGVGYSVAPVANATSYHWTVPAGATIMSGMNTNAISVDFSPTAVSGNITVNGVNLCGNGPSAQLPITVNILPVANAGSDVVIGYGTSTTLHAASGGAGSFSYQWSPATLLVDPNLQNPQTINLTVTSVFTLLVTNQVSMCTNTDQVIVAVSGGPLNLNPVAIPNPICRGTSSQLFANPGGGSGNYIYTWTCNPPGSPPWTSNQANPVVTPDASGLYQLSLYDGFSTVQGSTPLTVYPLPSATIQGGDTLCGESSSTVLTVDLTGVPPWTFYYSNGLTTWHVTGQNTTPFSIIATEAGVYSILSVSDAHCNGTTLGSALVAVFPFPPSPVISVNGTEIFSSGCCGNQWYKDGAVIPGATGSVYEPLVTAHYFDIVTINGCQSDTSNIIYYFMAGIPQHSANNLSFDPNPATNYITVKSNPASPAVDEVKIFSISGRQVASYVRTPLMDEGDIVMDIQQLSPGLYFLSISTKSGNTVMKLIVQ
ncbi:MAG: T9SS type A sorting domain-containing protein [Bacteroidetes bacterium]|nr:T9SS type A sorting domain-containing protein [Bacteroidota bacterium]